MNFLITKFSVENPLLLVGPSQHLCPRALSKQPHIPGSPLRTAILECRFADQIDAAAP